jgi:hypothetical protein
LQKTWLLAQCVGKYPAALINGRVKFWLQTASKACLVGSNFDPPLGLADFAKSARPGGVV